MSNGPAMRIGRAAHAIDEKAGRHGGEQRA